MYNRVNWRNSSQGATPLNADNLNVMDEAIASLDERMTNAEDYTQVATPSQLGVVRPDGTTTRVSASGVLTAINGGGGGASVATQVSFDDTTSHLGSSDVQGAIDNLVVDSGDWLKSRNLFDKFGTIKNSTVLNNSGGLDTSGNFNTLLDYISIEPNKAYTMSNTTGVDMACAFAFYNSSGTCVGYDYNRNTSSPFTMTSPSTATTMRVSYYSGFTPSYIMLNEGSSALSYQPYSESNVVLTEKVTESADWLKSKNLFDGIWVLGGINSGTDGSDDNTVTTAHRTPNYIKVSPNTKYTITSYDSDSYWTRIVGYKSDKTMITDGTGDQTGGFGYIGAGGTKTFETSATTQYLRLVTGKRTNDARVQLELGETSTSYQSGSYSNVQLTNELALTPKYYSFKKSVTAVKSDDTEVDITSNITSAGISLDNVLSFDVLIGYTSRYYNLNIATRTLGSSKATFYVHNDHSDSITNELKITVLYK